VPGSDAHGASAGGSEVAYSSAPVVPGRLLGARYELIRPIARGGMAEVWEGRDAILRRAVAIKVLQTHLAADVTFVERFRREAVTAARVAHPCVVATYDAGVDAGTAFIVMELVEGQTLRQLLTASAPLAPGLAVAIAQQIADALANAHRAGLVHRDIKPANILLCDDGAGALRVKVTDFGIAKVGAEIGADLTQIGTVLGTPKYLSPEQVEGRVEPDSRSDLYALGVVLFEMLTGRPPFSGQTAMATALSHLRDPPPHVSSLRPEIGAGLDAFVGRLLSKSPADRPGTAIAARLELDGLVREGLLAARATPPVRNAPAVRRAPLVRDAPVRDAPAGAVGNGGAGRAGSGVDGRTGSRRDGRPGSGVDGRAGAASGDKERPPALSGPIGHTSWSQRPETTPFRPEAGTIDLTDTGGRGRDATAVAPAGTNRRGTQPIPAPTRPADLPSGPVAVRRRRRRARLPGLVVAGIVLVAVIVAATLIADHGGAGNGRRSTTTPGPGSTAAVAAPGIQAVTVWMNTTGHTPDNRDETGAVFDGKASTAWNTDLYHGPNAAQFGGLYTGEGLAIHLNASKKLVRLVVDSPTQGWAASTYVAAAAPASGSAVSAWGPPTDSAPDINGNGTFSLAGRTGSWVLLWLTNLGPSAHASISELTVS
jgi:tRNA A-37 threonylcarbamoyl transferase component Bud32